LLATDPSVRWCPVVNCEKYMRGSKKKPHLKCECGYEMCFSCRQPWHGKKTCEKAFDKEVVEWSKEAKVEVKDCPSCKVKVDKKDGCNHMTCLYCSYEWCWICGTGYTRFHFFKYNPFGCPGMQYANKRELIISKIKAFFVGFLYLIVALTLGLAVLFVISSHKNMKRRGRRSFYNKYIVLRILMLFLFVITGLLINAIVGPLALIIGPFVLLVIYTKMRIRLHKKTKRKLLLLKKLDKMNSEKKVDIVIINEVPPVQ